MIVISKETKEKVGKYLKEYKYTCSVVSGEVTNLSVIINFT